MDDKLASLAVALAAARESDLLAGLQLSEAQRSLGLSPHLVFLAGVALALPAQVDGGGATFAAGQERTFARLQIAYGQACRRGASDGAPPHPTQLYKLSPLLIPAQPLSIAELLRVSSEAGASPAAPAPDAPAPDAPDAALAAACAAAAAAAAQLLAEENTEERRPGSAASVPSPRAKPKGRVRPPGPPRAQGSSRGGSQVDQPRAGDLTLALTLTLTLTPTLTLTLTLTLTRSRAGRGGAERRRRARAIERAIERASAASPTSRRLRCARSTRRPSTPRSGPRSVSQ